MIEQNAHESLPSRLLLSQQRSKMWAPLRPRAHLQRILRPAQTTLQRSSLQVYHRNTAPEWMSTIAVPKRLRKEPYQEGQIRRALAGEASVRTSPCHFIGQHFVAARCEQEKERLLHRKEIEQPHQLIRIQKLLLLLLRA